MQFAFSLRKKPTTTSTILNLQQEATKNGRNHSKWLPMTCAFVSRFAFVFLPKLNDKMINNQNFILENLRQYLII